MFSFKKIILLAGGFIALSTVVLVYAETQTFTVGIRFIAPLSFANEINPDFGRFEAGTSGRHFILGTDGTISGTDAAAYVDGANAGSLDDQRTCEVDTLATRLRRGNANPAAVLFRRN